MPDLCVFIPTYHRRERMEECLKSFRETTLGEVDLYLVVDEGDDSYEGIDAEIITVKPGTLVTVINDAVAQLVDRYDALFMASDDVIFRTPGWDLFMTGMLEQMGGTGFVYPDDKRRYDIPELILISSDIVKALGHFAEPSLDHFCIDNVWAELGKRLGLIRFCPQAVIEHLHWTISPDIARDETYIMAEENFGGVDQMKYQVWQATKMQNQAAMLRRKFNPDVKWVLELI